MEVFPDRHSETNALSISARLSCINRKYDPFSFFDCAPGLFHLREGDRLDRDAQMPLRCEGEELWNGAHDLIQRDAAEAAALDR